MRVLLIVASLAALVAARPEAGYSYNVPSHRYGSPFSGIFADRPSYYNNNGLNSGKGFFDFSLLKDDSNPGVGGAREFTGADFLRGGFDGNFLAGGGGGGVVNLGGGGGLIGSNGGGGGGPGGGALFRSNGGVGGTGGGVLRTTSVYAHVAPPDFEEDIRAQQVIAPRQARINYKIVFIKAPTAPTPVNPVIPEFAQDQEKTLIYVLVKKPDEADDIVIPTPTPTVPSKPEVFFIKYKTQKQVVGGGGGGDDFGTNVGIRTGTGIGTGVGTGTGVGIGDIAIDDPRSLGTGIRTGINGLNIGSVSGRYGVPGALGY